MFLINCVLLIGPLAVFVTYSTSNRFGVVFFGVLITLLISLFFWVLNKRDQLYAILQTRATELETQNHIIREAAIRDDLKIARMYQENLAQPAVEQLVGGNSIRILNRLPGRFRRDWVGIREISGDRYVMGIAVANESGVLGALAIQTAQSLWMGSLQDVSWDPLKWMHSVHNILRLMNMESPQTMNVGILVLDADNPVYHVAGGLTLFASVHLSTAPDMPHRFGGDSPPLGRSELPEITSHQIIMPGTKFDNFFLTNDEHSRDPGTEQTTSLAVLINTSSH